MLASRPGWFDLTWAISRQRLLAARWKVFLTVNGVDGDDAAGQPEFADKTLHGGNLVGLAVDFDMAEDERAFDVESALVLGHIEIDGKSNEIPAVERLIGELGLAGCVVTVDAIHCQKNLPACRQEALPADCPGQIEPAGPAGEHHAAEPG